MLKKKYPVTGELLDVVSKSVQEKISGRLEEESAERITAKRIKNPDLRASVLIGEKIRFGTSGDVTSVGPRMKEKESETRNRKRK